MSGHPLLLFPDFRRLFIGRLISGIGDKFFAIALSWWVLTQDPANGRFQLGLLMAAVTLPIVLFGPLSGTLVDRQDRRRCMLVANAGRGLLILLLFTLLISQTLSLPLLFLICFCSAALIPLFESAVNASLNDLTDHEHLGGAVALNSSTLQFANIIGAALGGVFIAALGASGAFLFNAASYALSFLFIALIVTPLPALSGGQQRYGAQLREGFGYLGQEKPLLALLTLFGFLNFFAMPLLLIIPMLVKYTLNEQVYWVGIFEASMAAGYAVTAIGLGFRRQLRAIYPSIFAGLLLMALVQLGIAAWPQKYLIAGLLFLSGVSFAFVTATTLTLFQHTVPAAMKGRFFAMLTTVCYAVMPLAFVVNGFLAQAHSIAFILFLNGGVIAAIAGVVLVIPRVCNELSPGKPHAKTSVCP